jgi:hypothetical protein
MKQLGVSRIVVLMLAMLMLAPSLLGCAKKKRIAAETETPATNPLNPQPGGAPAQGVVQRGAQRQVNQQLLRSLGQYYMLYRTEHGRDPQNLQEFLNYLKSDPNARAAKVPEALESGWVVIVFTPNISGNQILAYEKEAFQQFQNRLVLFGDGSVKLMNESEFQTALKAP